MAARLKRQPAASAGGGSAASPGQQPPDGSTAGKSPSKGKSGGGMRQARAWLTGLSDSLPVSKPGRFG